MIKDDEPDKLPSPRMCSVINKGFCKQVNLLPHFYLGQEKEKQMEKMYRLKDSDTIIEDVDPKAPKFESSELRHLNSKPSLQYLKGQSRIVFRVIFKKEKLFPEKKPRVPVYSEAQKVKPAKPFTSREFRKLIDRVIVNMRNKHAEKGDTPFIPYSHLSQV